MRVTGNEAAARVIERMRVTRKGELTITIGTGCCESTAPFLFEDFWPGPDQQVIGEVLDVAVYAPDYLRVNYPDDDGVVIDVVENVSAESMSIETKFDCRLILRGMGVDLGVEAVCEVPTETASTLANGGASRVVGELPEALRRVRLR